MLIPNSLKSVIGGLLPFLDWFLARVCLLSSYWLFFTCSNSTVTFSVCDLLDLWQMDNPTNFAASILIDNPYFSAGVGLFGMGMGVALLRRCGQFASVLLRRNLTLTMEIASHDSSYQWVMHWLSKRARCTKGSRLQRGAGQHFSVETSVVRTEAGRIKSAFEFIPSTGVHYIFHQGHILRVERIRSQQTLQGASVAPFESVTLTTLGFNTQIFRDILEEARCAAIAKDVGWTVIYKVASIVHSSLHLLGLWIRVAPIWVPTSSASA